MAANKFPYFFAKLAPAQEHPHCYLVFDPMKTIAWLKRRCATFGRAAELTQASSSSNQRLLQVLTPS